MPEVIMEYDLDETGKMVNLRQKEEIVRCKECGFCVRGECCRTGYTAKPIGYCDEGGRKR